MRSGAFAHMVLTSRHMEGGGGGGGTLSHVNVSLAYIPLTTCLMLSHVIHVYICIQYYYYTSPSTYGEPCVYYLSPYSNCSLCFINNVSSHKCITPSLCACNLCYHYISISLAPLSVSPIADTLIHPRDNAGL